MKNIKNIWILLLSLANAAQALAQGYVNFANSVSSRVSNGGVLQTAAPRGSYYYALLVAPSTQNTIDTTIHTTAFAGWTFVAYGTNTGTAGRMTGNNADGGAAVQINAGAFTAAGGTADFALVGWSGNIGNDWNAVRAGYQSGLNWQIVDPTKPGGTANVWFGVSAVANDIVLQPFGSSYNSVFGAAAIPGLNLIVPFPEPSNFTLFGVAVTAMLVFRRQSSKSQE